MTRKNHNSKKPLWPEVLSYATIRRKLYNTKYDFEDVLKRTKQQRLDAKNRMIYFVDVRRLFVGVTVVYIVLGCYMLHTAKNIKEVRVPYSSGDCIAIGNDSKAADCEDFVRNNTGKECQCEITITLNEGLQGAVYLYYSLTNFFQNHRRFQKSLDLKQLKGMMTADKSCEPLRVDPTSGRVYAPCGLLANSIFNDSFRLFHNRSELIIVKKNLAWSSDREHRFKNPPSWANTTKPPFWRQAVYELNHSKYESNGYKSEPLMVWLNVAMSGNFIKLYGIINAVIDPFFGHGLPPGVYTLRINYAYPVSFYKGEKSFFLMSLSWLGRSDRVLGWCYIVVGTCALVTYLYLKHLYKRETSYFENVLHRTDSTTAFNLK